MNSHWVRGSFQVDAENLVLLSVQPVGREIYPDAPAFLRFSRGSGTLGGSACWSSVRLFLKTSNEKWMFNTRPG